MTQRKKPVAKTTAKNSAAARAKNSTHKQPQSKPSHGLTWLKTFVILCVFVLCGVVWQSLFRPLSVAATGKLLQIKSGQTYSGLIGCDSKNLSTCVYSQYAESGNL
jgi:hypothetical protein